MKVIFIIFCTISVVIGFEPDWINFKAKYHVKFERNVDEKLSFINFKLNKIKRESHNKNLAKTFKMAENKFSHLSYKQFSERFCKTILPDELKSSKRVKRQVSSDSIVTGEIITLSTTSTTSTTVKPTTKAPSSSTNIFGNYTASNLPASVDYTYLMQPVIDQGDCGSCWALAVMSQIEAIMKFRYPFFNNQLSPQILLDCDFLNYGCEGGWPYDSMSKIYLAVLI